MLFRSRFIINAGIEKVIVRKDKIKYKIVFVQEWIENDDSIQGDGGY